MNKLAGSVSVWQKARCFIENRRLFIAILWSVLTVLGVAAWFYSISMPEPVYLVVYILTGFHIPQNALDGMMIFGLFSEHPQMVIVCMLVLLAFVVLWVISLIKLNSSKMFEKLILADRVGSLLMLCMTAIIQRTEFSGWHLFILPIAEIILLLLIKHFMSKNAIK